MRKFHLILLAGAVAVLIIGDVVEIRFHADKLAALPAAVSAAAKDGSLYEKARAQALALRRAADRWIIKDQRQRYEVALTYVEQDSERLKEKPNSVQALLLEQSLDRLRREAESISLEDLSSLKEKTAAAVTGAQTTLEAVKDATAGYDSLKDRLAEVKEYLEKQIGRFNVAGVSVEASPVPLKF